ncbi:MAG: ATP phosphoribosyltransferase [Clostridiales bacterium]|jgi:ATP phosphoribosyltransferase|nr:ATP phosphoribosyltransferase [Clostridiales bacterium]
MSYLTLALAKGRLSDLGLELLARVGLGCDMDKRSRKLVYVNEDKQLRFFMAKPADVPTYVEHGAADLGIAGSDTIREEGRSLYETLDLGFGKCKMVVAGFEYAVDRLKYGNGLRVATKYPNIARRYFEEKRQTVEIIKLNGSVELGPIVGLSDVIVDLVESGATLSANGLVELDTVCEISARLLVNRVSMKMEYERVTDIINSLKGFVDDHN